MKPFLLLFGFCLLALPSIALLLSADRAASSEESCNLDVMYK